MTRNILPIPQTDRPYTSIDSFSRAFQCVCSFFYDRASPFEAVERGPLRRCCRVDLVPTFGLRGRRRAVLTGARVVPTSQLVTCQCREPFGRRDSSRAQEEGLLLLLYRLTRTVTEPSEFNINPCGYVVFASVFLGGTVRLIFVPQFPQTGFHQRLTIIRLR